MHEEFRKPPYRDRKPAALLADSMHDEVIAQAYSKKPAQVTHQQAVPKDKTAKRMRIALNMLAIDEKY